MYSDMSRRTIADSSSKRNWARARASSVFPTPVGPMNRKDPIGRRGSFKPDLARRTAFETSRTASSCPTTRLVSRSSIRTSFSISPSTSLDTGIPVQRETIWAMSSSSTSSLRSRSLCGDTPLPYSGDESGMSPVSETGVSPLSSSASRCSAGMTPNLSSDALPRFPSRSARCISERARSMFSLISRLLPMDFFSSSHRERYSVAFPFSPASSFPRRRRSPSTGPAFPSPAG
jgi:hypothetical protein